MTLICQIILLAVLLVNIIHHSVAPPVTQKPEVENDILDNIGVEYKRYLQEVVQTLESDDQFRAKLEKAEDVDLRTGKIAQELQYVRHDVRSKLDELKRAELERLRHYIRRQTELKQGLDPDHIKIVNDQTGHIDGGNPHSFEIADLEKLIAKTSQHLAEADRKRREEFKLYELQKEFERNQDKKSMSDLDKDMLDLKLSNQRSALRHRQEQLHHPGSKKQLQEVWQYQDHMNVRDFDPKTFFFMHDVDGNGYLDQEEVKALFLRELQKLYSMGYLGEDLRERTEEMERMREHVFVEADVNHDGVISLQEWIDLTRRPDFNTDPGWEALDPRNEFTEEEYRQFEQQRQNEIEALIAQGKLPPKTPVQIQREAMYAKRKKDAIEAFEKHRAAYLKRKQSLTPIDPKDLYYSRQYQQQLRAQQQQVPPEGQPHPQDQAHLQAQQQASLQAQQQQAHPQAQQQAHFQPDQQAHFQPQQQQAPPQAHLQPEQQAEFQPQQQAHPQAQQQAQFQPQQQAQFQPQQQAQFQLQQQEHPQQDMHPQQLGQKQPLQQSDQHQQAPAQQNAIPQHEDNIKH